MPAAGTCSACNHPARVALDYDLLQGVYSNEVGRRHGLTTQMIVNHRRKGHHHLQTPRQGSTGPHTAAGLMERIEKNLADAEALRDLRIAVLNLPPRERPLHVEELPRRAGRVAEPEREAAA